MSPETDFTADQIWWHIDAERAALADVLEGLDDDAWSTDSLCAGWRVRDVAAHLTMATAGTADMLPWLLRTGFSFDKAIRESAIALPADRAEIVDRLRALVGCRRTAPFVSIREPLIDILVHTQDICVPLGREVPEPAPTPTSGSRADAAAAAADRVLALNRRPVVSLRRLPRGVQLVAVDADWSWGRGELITGAMTHLLLALAGRRAAAALLSGPVHLLDR
ncbi:maleylpyruvate isomerase family mycothiol-dependent enzyme [Gordonia phosphorivorans]|uniref:Maleylpyruvate isomerase family mycothiol-dependent enzyme n=1 Tax=Gordonia phosphorivorans TaxID=1056982 RepID=A0ABV6H895_9ACTN